MPDSIGGSIGSPTQLSYRELETTAAAEMAKSMMKIVSDTVDLNFFLLDEGVRKYQAPANRPNLTSPLSSVRMATLSPTSTEQNWQAVYEQLKTGLPDGLQQLLGLTLEMPPDQRGAHVMVLDSMLQTTAKALVLLSIAAGTVDAESLPAMRAESNLAAPYLALASSVIVDRTLLREALNVLALVGPNDPHFSALSGYLGQYSNIALDMEEAVQVLQNPANFKDGMDKIADLATSVATLRNEFNALYGGAELGLLGSILASSANVTAALTLENRGAAAILLSLSMANVGLDDNKSQASAIGLGLASALSGISAALGQLFVPKEDVGSQQVLEQLGSTALAGAVLLGSLTYSQGLPIAGSDSNPEVRAEKSFAYSLALSLLGKMGVITNVARAIADATNLPPESQEKMASLLSTAALSLLIASAAKERDASSVEPLIADQREELKKGVEEAITVVTDKLTAGNIQGEDWATGSVFLQQTLIALNNGDGAAFLDAMNSMLGLAGTSNEKVLADMGSLADYAKSSMALLQDSADDAASNWTGIYSPA